MSMDYMEHDDDALRTTRRWLGFDDRRQGPPGFEQPVFGRLFALAILTAFLSILSIPGQTDAAGMPDGAVDHLDGGTVLQSYGALLILVPLSETAVLCATLRVLSYLLPAPHLIVPVISIVAAALHDRETVFGYATVLVGFVIMSYTYFAVPRSEIRFFMAACYLFFFHFCHDAVVAAGCLTLVWLAG